MLFAHIADTHLGYRQFNLEERERDFYRVFHESVDKMLEEGVELVIHAGDLFDEPRPPIRALVEAKRGINRLLEEGIRVVMIPGNHDMIMRRGSMAPHAIFDGVEVLTLDQPSVVVDDVFIGGVPYLSKSYRDVLLENITALEKEAAEYKRSMLVLHQGIDKYLPYEHELEIGELPQGFGYYALGHVHGRVEEDFGKGMLCYSGSTEVWRSEEAAGWEKDGKGFLITDTGKMMPRRVDLEGIRPFVKAEVALVDDIHDIRERIVDLKEPILSIIIRSDEEVNYLHDRIKEELSDKALYIASRKAPVFRDETIVKGGVVDVRELVSEALQDFGEGAQAFGLEMFGALAKNDIEGALTLSEDFFSRWKEK